MILICILDLELTISASSMEYTDTKHFHFFAISIAFHSLFLGLCILISYIHINFFDAELNLIDKNPNIIKVNFVEVKAENSQPAPKAITQTKKLEKSGYYKPSALKQPLVKQSKGISSENRKNKISEANKKYEHLLSQQFMKISSKISELFYDLERIDIWVKIDKYGNIVDSGVAENISKNKLYTIKNEVLKLSPLPEPPILSFGEYSELQYLIPILIK